VVTIYSQISLSGIALRTGEQATVHLNWQDRDGGPILIWPGCPEGLSAAQAFTLGRRSERMTELLCPPQNLVMSEHLMAALAFYPHLPLSIDCPQGVLPLLDGSAEPWVHAFAAIAQDHRETHQAPQEYASALRLNWAWEGGFLKAEASDHFAVIYEVEKGGYHSRYSLTAAALAITEVLPARTFIWRRLVGGSVPRKTKGCHGRFRSLTGRHLSRSGKSFQCIFTEFPGL
jgi:UDP-3-O-acyl-N-acetylglucosamine deacetylase